MEHRSDQGSIPYIYCFDKPLYVENCVFSHSVTIGIHQWGKMSPTSTHQTVSSHLITQKRETEERELLGGRHFTKPGQGFIVDAKAEHGIMFRL